MPPRGYRHLSIREDVYRGLEELAGRLGLGSVAEAVSYLLQVGVSLPQNGVNGGQAIDLSQLESTLSNALKKAVRELQDALNAYTARIEQLAQSYAQLVEKLEGIERRLERIESSTAVAGKNPNKPRQRKSAIERLKDEKVLYESELAERMSADSRDRFFSFLESHGALVLKTEKERVALTRDSWEEFKQLLGQLGSLGEEEVLKKLGKYARLFQLLREAGYIVYNNKDKRWVLHEGPG